MSTFGKVLAILNLLAVIPLLILASNSLALRIKYAEAIKSLTEQRDGITTEKLLQGLSPQAQQEIAQTLRSEFSQRRVAGEKLFEPTKRLPISQEAEALRQKLGPDDFKQLVQKYIKLEQPKLTDEERALTNKKILLLTLKSRYENQKAALETEIVRLQAAMTQEADLLRRVEVENVQRQREIARLRSELEEAVAARNVAQGNLRTAQSYLDRAVAEARMLADQNQALAAQIQGQAIPR